MRIDLAAPIELVDHGSNAGDRLVIPRELIQMGQVQRGFVDAERGDPGPGEARERPLVAGAATKIAGTAIVGDEEGRAVAGSGDGRREILAGEDFTGWVLPGHEGGVWARHGGQRGVRIEEHDPLAGFEVNALQSGRRVRVGADAHRIAVANSAGIVPAGVAPAGQEPRRPNDRPNRPGRQVPEPERLTPAAVVIHRAEDDLIVAWAPDGGDDVDAGA